MVIYLPNATSAEDVQATILHEVVGHYGLRKLFGESFDNELMGIYKLLPEDVRKEIAKEALRNYDSDLIIAMEEYLAQQAEKNEMPGWWNRVVSSFKDFLRKMGISLEISDNDVRYLLWKTLVIHSRDMLRDQLKEIGVASEDIDKYERWFDEGSTMAFWAPKYDRVFVPDTSVPKQELNGYLWHENTHKALYGLEDYDDIVLTISNYVEREFSELYDYVADMYKEDGDYIIHEECVSHLLEYMAYSNMDRMESGYVKLEGPVGDAIRKLLDIINYGKENNENQYGLREDFRRRESAGSRSPSAERQNSGNSEGRNREIAETEGGTKSRKSGLIRSRDTGTDDLFANEQNSDNTDKNSSLL